MRQESSGQVVACRSPLQDWLLELPGVSFSDGRFHLPPVPEGLKEVDKNERTAVVVLTRRIRDRQGDILEPAGVRLKSFRKNPVVLWAHDYRGLPIGKSLWEKAQGDALIAKVRFANTDFAQQVWQLVQSGFLNSWSVGFVPIQAEPVKEGGKFTGYRIKEWELLEYSAVPVPANPEALTVEVRSRISHPVLLKSLGLLETDKDADEPMQGQASQPEGSVSSLVPAEERRGAIPYKETPKDPEDAPWDGPKEVRQAEVEDLKIMCAWVAPEHADTKQGYKLPHHRAKGHKVVWKGVAAAMAALLGARGGVNIPEKDKKAVFQHLAKHYKQFDKEPPELRSYSRAEADKIFDEPSPRRENINLDLPASEGLAFVLDQLKVLIARISSLQDTRRSLKVGGEMFSELDKGLTDTKELAGSIIRALDELGDDTDSLTLAIEQDSSACSPDLGYEIVDEPERIPRSNHESGIAALRARGESSGFYKKEGATPEISAELISLVLDAIRGEIRRATGRVN